MDPAVIAAAFCLDGPALEREYGSYVAGLDLGTVNDRTVLAIGHRDGDRVVLDRMQCWQGSRSRPVDFAEVEAFIVQAHRRFQFSLRLDPWQGLDLAQRLRAQSVRAEEFTFTAASKQRLAASLLSTLNSGNLRLYEAEGLRDELLGLRLVQTSSGAWAFDHARGGHDDRAVALALMVVALALMVVASSGAPIFAAEPSRSRWDVTGDAFGPRPAPVTVARPTQEPEADEDEDPPPHYVAAYPTEDMARAEWNRHRRRERERAGRARSLLTVPARPSRWRLDGPEGAQ